MCVQNSAGAANPELVKIEKRVARLEEEGYFQEERLRALDAQLLAQQAIVDSLKVEIERLKGVIEQARATLVDMAGVTAPGDEIPPHSVSTGWHLD